MEENPKIKHTKIHKKKKRNKKNRILYLAERNAATHTQTHIKWKLFYQVDIIKGKCETKLRMCGFLALDFKLKNPKTKK